VNPGYVGHLEEFADVDAAATIHVRRGNLRYGPAVRVTRRGFLGTVGVVAGMAAGAGLYTWQVEPNWPVVVQRQLPVRALPARLVGRTLVQISDTHVGPSVEDNYLVDVFRQVASLRPDIVVVTGDLVSYHADIYSQLEAVYRHFPRGRIATCAILGNHDYGPDWAHPEIAQRIADIVAGFGVTVLRNQIHDVEGMQVAGLDDLWANRVSGSPIRRLDDTRAALVLAHNPDTADVPIWDGFEGWILAGHTHGGQCKPPFLPPPLVPVRNKRYTAGEFVLSGNRRLYINRGVGHGPQVRFNARPEITVFELRPA
jgi:uncharacterized protein